MEAGPGIIVAADLARSGLRRCNQGGPMVSKEFIRQLEGYGLTTAKILYRMPDHPGLLQSYVWQDYELDPKFPVLLDFMDFV
jgi:hypothetical protein